MGEQQEVILTQEGFDKLEEELNYLKTEKRTDSSWSVREGLSNHWNGESILLQK